MTDIPKAVEERAKKWAESRRLELTSQTVSIRQERIKGYLTAVREECLPFEEASRNLLRVYDHSKGDAEQISALERMQEVLRKFRGEK